MTCKVINSSWDLSYNQQSHRETISLLQSLPCVALRRFRSLFWVQEKTNFQLFTHCSQLRLSCPSISLLLRRVLLPSELIFPHRTGEAKILSASPAAASWRCQTNRITCFPLSFHEQPGPCAATINQSFNVFTRSSPWLGRWLETHCCWMIKMSLSLSPGCYFYMLFMRMHVNLQHMQCDSFCVFISAVGLSLLFVHIHFAKSIKVFLITVPPII